MADILKKLKIERDSIYIQAAQIVATLQEAGYKAYFVGGCVRDLLLGCKPKDYDIATDAKPDEVQEIFSSARGVGKRFGVSVVPAETAEFEIAAFREDGFYYDHRRPAWVNYAGITEDAVRRDFSINALYFNPADNTIIDLVDGKKDVENRALRMIGDPFERFDEDWLRMLRAVRFAARFALKFDLLTWDALRTLAPMISGIPPERQTDEVRLMLQGSNPGRAVGLLYSSGLWAGMWQDLPYTTCRVRKAVNLLKKKKSKSSVWASFLVDLPGAAMVNICENLRLTRSEKKALGIK